MPAGAVVSKVAPVAVLIDPVVLLAAAVTVTTILTEPSAVVAVATVDVDEVAPEVPVVIVNAPVFWLASRS